MIKGLIKCLFFVLLSGFAFGQEKETVNLDITLIDIHRAVYTVENAESATAQANITPNFFETDLTKVNTYTMPIAALADPKTFINGFYKKSTVRNKTVAGVDKAGVPPVTSPNTLMIYEVIPD